MSGRRLLDAALVFNATRAVGRKHFQIRYEQLDIWRKTSAIAKALRIEPRIVRVQQSADILAQQSVHYTNNADNVEQQTIPRAATVAKDGGEVKEKIVAGQDHHYERSEKNSASDPVHEGALDIKQEKAARHPTPDGSIPPAGAPVSVGVGREQNPDVVSERVLDPRPSPLSETKPEKEGSLEPESSRKSTIPDPLTKTSSKIPAHGVVPEQEEIPEGINTDVFHSPRIARLLGQRSTRQKSGQDLPLKGVKETPVDQSQLSEGKDQDTFNVRESGSGTMKSDAPDAQKDTPTKAQAVDRDTQALASAIAAETELPLNVST